MGRRRRNPAGAGCAGSGRASRPFRFPSRRARADAAAMHRAPGFALAILFAVNTLNFYDRQVLGALTEPIRHEWGLDDFAAGALYVSFTLLYAVAGVPIGRLTDL